MPVPLSLISTMLSRQRESEPLDSFEVFASGLPDGWTLDSGNSTYITANTNYSTDGSQSVRFDPEAAGETLRISKVFDLSGVNTLNLDYNSESGGSGGGTFGFRALDNSGSTIDRTSLASSGTGTLSLDLSSTADNNKTTATVVLDAGYPSLTYFDTVVLSVDSLR